VGGGYPSPCSRRRRQLFSVQLYAVSTTTTRLDNGHWPCKVNLVAVVALQGARTIAGEERENEFRLMLSAMPTTTLRENVGVCLALDFNPNTIGANISAHRQTSLPRKGVCFLNTSQFQQVVRRIES